MSNNKKVLHIIASLGNGGAERQLIELLKYNKSHAVLLLSDAGVYKKTLNSCNIKYWELEVKNKFIIFFKFFAFIKVIKLFKPDIIQSWMYNACLFSTFCKVLSFNKTPIIWCIRCSNMITNHYSYILKLSILCCKYFSKKADKIIYNSFAGMKYHIGIGFNKKKKNIIFNGVDKKKFKYNKSLREKLRKKYKIRSNETVIICVARVDPMKNYNNLLKAYKKIDEKKMKNLKLVIIGKGTEYLNISKGCLALGMKLDIEKYYNMADIIILPSAFGEGFSNVLVEGMLTGLLPTATDVGDSKYIIGDTGFLIRKSDYGSIKKILLKLSNLKKNTLLIKRKKAKYRAKKLFSPEKMLKKYSDIYDEILN